MTRLDRANQHEGQVAVRLGICRPSSANKLSAIKRTGSTSKGPKMLFKWYRFNRVVVSGVNRETVVMGMDVEGRRREGRLKWRRVGC